MSTPSADDTPRRSFLKYGIRELSDEIQIKNSKLRKLQQTIRRKNKKIASMAEIIKSLKNKNLLNENDSNVLFESFGKHSDLISNWSKKNLGKKVPKKFSPAIRQFALSLHFFSPKAYQYVRKQFNTVLPHTRTLGKWYSHVDADPGFTEEALKSLTLKASHTRNPIYCSLMLDEMAIRQHLEFSGTKYYGRIDFGHGLDSDSLDIAKDCLVFMVVSLNEGWKLPIGYFLTANLTCMQKAELTKQALYVLKATGINVVSLTLDGCSTNVSMARILGCDFNIERFKTNFTVEFSEKEKENICLFLDPAHMIKLVRNTFGEKKIFQHKNDYIKFDFVETLFVLQEQEGCHLANKLRKQHIFYFKQKMKVKLATQLLSKSVADALKFCKYNLNIDDFADVDATVKFIELFNSAFDILNSRSINAIGEKKALCNENYQYIVEFTEMFTKYVKDLKVKEKNNFIPVLESNRKTGFIGLLVCLNSLLQLYSSLIATGILDHLKLYKISQDHLELFFGSIRSQGGYNNNPTARQFQSAYKKLVIRVNDIESFNTGNCIPLEHIDILHYSSSDPIKVLNMNSNNNNNKLDLILSANEVLENNQAVETYINDHDYICKPEEYIINNFSKEVTIYIAGFAVYKLTSVLHCEICIKSLCAINKGVFLNSLITMKNKGGNNGGLMYPSEDVLEICFQTEKILKLNYFETRAINTIEIQSKILTYVLHHRKIFKSLEFHSADSNSPISDHLTLLIKSITYTYVKLKINHSLKNRNETPSLRTWYNKLIIFKGK